MHPLIEVHRRESRALAEQHRMRAVHVFGSMGRDDADEDSDVDLLVETTSATADLETRSRNPSPSCPSP